MLLLANDRMCPFWLLHHAADGTHKGGNHHEKIFTRGGLLQLLQVIETSSFGITSELYINVARFSCEITKLTRRVPLSHLFVLVINMKRTCNSIIISQHKLCNTFARFLRVELVHMLLITELLLLLLVVVVIFFEKQNGPSSPHKSTKTQHEANNPMHSEEPATLKG